MSNRDAVAVIEFSIELDHFFNIDLYVGGFYQLRCQLKTPKKLPSRIDVSIPRSDAPQLFPASVVNGKAVGTAFEVIYKEEDISFCDVIEYKAFVPLKMSKLPNILQFFLSLELWYIDKEEMLKKASSDVYTSFECVSRRQLTINFPLFRGLHYYRPVLFDYFHLCAATVTVHSSLVALEMSAYSSTAALKQSQLSFDKSTNSSVNNVGANNYLSPPGGNADTASGSSTPRRNSNTSMASSPDSFKRFGPNSSCNLTTFEDAVFGGLPKNTASSSQRLQNAYQFHRSVCRLLLTAYEALELKLTHLLHCLPSRYQIRIQSVDCAKKFEVLQQNVQRIEDENELLSTIEGNAALLSGELTLLWRQFLDLFRGRDEIRRQLAKEHHTARVRRFAEGFFNDSECGSQTTALINFSNVGQMEKLHERLEEQLRKSTYFQCLPPLGVYCEELDGGAGILPVVFEQRYQPTTSNFEDEKFSMRHSISASAHMENSIESTSKKKDLLKETLSLDLPHVNRPAKKKTEEKSTKNDSTETKTETKKFSKIPSTKRPMFLRNASFKTWYRQRRLHTFPMSREETTKFDRKLENNATEPSTSNRRFPGAKNLIRCAKLFRSTPDLKMHAAFSANAKRNSVDIKQITVSVGSEMGESRKQDPVLTSTVSEALECLNCCQSMDLSSVVEPGTDRGAEREGSDELSESNETVATEREEETVYREDGSPEGTGVSYGLDALALESSIMSPSQMPASVDSIPRLTSGIEREILDFVSAKEQYKQRMRDVAFDGILCSDFAAFPSTIPYFQNWKTGEYENGSDLHLVVCVHGLDGTCADLRMVRAYIELGLPNSRIDFLMSKRNQMDTFNDFETMTRNLVDELLLYLSHCTVHPKRISFIGHSLGNIIIRSALADPRLEPWMEKLYTFLSLNGPHCGILYNNNSMVNMGIWFVQRWKKSISLQQMALKDNPDLRQTFIYQLSMKPCLQNFKYVLLVGSHDDFYVPMHSALIQVCRSALKDPTILGQAYTEMVHNIMQPLLNNSRTTVIRYSVFHAQQASSTTSHILGRAAHIAVLDSDLFIEKLLTVSALRYFV